MRMRAGVLWSAVALALLAITSALRTTQVEGVTRTSRRLAVTSAASDSNIVPSIGQDAAQPTFKSRGTKRHEETSSQSNIVRTRTRTRVEIPPTAQAQIQSTPKNERFDSRRTRTRSQPALTDLESNKDSTLTKDTVNRSRSRAHSRRPTLTTTTLASVELTSPASDESKLEIINSNLDDITKIPTEAPTAATEANQFRRRNIPPTTESVTPQRSRGRINTRPNVRSLDLAVSGTINTLTKVEKTPTTARSAPDLRNSKKLRYRTRPSETDTNLTGKGLLSANEVIKSSQNRRSGTSQEVAPNTAPVVAETIIQQSTETNEPKTTTTQVTKVIKRPVPSRRNANFRPTASLATVSKVSDEISEDDNYPASFKALIQAKNASTQVSSPTTESLSLKGSQKVHKTYSTTSSHSTLTGPSTNKFSRWRTKQAAEEPKVDNIVNSKTVETTPAPEVSRSQTYKPRGTYAPRNRKSTFTPSSTRTTPSGESSSEKSSFKYSRKLKVSTTELPKLDSVKSKSVESSQEIKKPFVRPPFNLRKSKGKNEPKLVTSNETTISGNRIRKESVKPLQRPTLPRTSFYTKTRNLKTKNEISSTMDPLKEETTEAINKKSEENVETPFVFALLNNSEAVRIDTQPENKDNHMFLIAVTSKESLENTTSNEVTNTAEESENKPVVNVLPIVSTKQESDRYKYHSNYKDQNLKNTDNKEKTSSTVFPLVRNLQTRKYGRNRTKSVTNKDVVVTSPKTFRTVRKFSESFSKTTEASNNGITSEPEKTKNRFSSKYRASYLDKPFYKPTVPTITPSTAWLKFYVTDHLLTKSVEEPNWFEGDIYTTESMSRLNTTPYIHESSLEPVEGEEIQLGPDLNAISFTQTRRTLDSADLRLSESLVKPSHVMNVEASHHSPSVTISIFDALAEILTSTPRPRLSSTTEMTKIKPLNTDVKQVLNGVSNNVNVNSVQGLVSQDTFVLTNADVSTTTKTVQPTVQTPNVINSILVEGTVTQSLNTEDGNSIPVNTLQTSVPSPKSTPTPTTPVSARKPFAIRILYSDTESSTDKLTTASQPTQGSTDNPKTISTSALNFKSSNGIITTNMPEKSTASHVLSLRTTTMLPSIDEILLNSISSAAKQDMVISEMTSSTREPRILTLDIDPETKQIRTEKPGEGDTSAVFKFIPIDEIMVQTQDSNVLKLSSTKAPPTKSGQSKVQTVVATSVTEINTQTPQIQTQETTAEATTFQITTSIVPETTVVSSAFTNTPDTPETTSLPSTTTTTSEPTTTTTTTTTATTTTTTPMPTTTTTTPAQVTTTTMPTTSTTQATVSTQTPTTTQVPTTMLPLKTLSVEEELRRYQEDVQLLKTLLQATGRDPKSLNLNPNFFSFGDLTSTTAPTTTTQQTTTTASTTTTQQNDAAKLLQALITNLNNPTTLSVPREATKQQVTTTTRSIEDDIKQFEEDTKLLQALLQATGQNPANLNIPSLDSLTTTRTFTTNTQTIPTTTFGPTTTTVRPTTTTTARPTTTVRPTTTTESIEDDLRQFQEDTKLLQALLQATGQNPQNLNIPIVTGVTSNVRIASNPQTTSLGSNPTTPLNIRPVYTTTNGPIFKTFAPRTIVPTLQPTTENVKISTTFQPFNQRRQPTTTAKGAVLTGRRAGFTSTTEMPSTSTFSVEEDLAFLNNLKTALNTNPKNDDPEAALANRIIALAVEKSLNEIQTGKSDATRTGKNIAVSPNNLIPLTTNKPTTTTRPTTTTTTTTTTTLRPTTTQRITTTVNSPSLDDDIRQFQEDTKLLQALLKATGQDPSKLNLPTLPPNINDVQETTTQKTKLTITGQSADEALKKLVRQQKPSGMVSEATQSPISLSTEYGKSNDALLAALLKEQGFGPTTASSLDEQLRLSALLNQVVVTPKARRTTTPPPPPPPAPRRPILDGLAWLWQQWRETAPGSGPPRPSRGPASAPAPSARPSMSSTATSNGASWLGSGPFVGNADDTPANRIPLEPPRSVASEQTPGRGQLVSAAINVTRAFSQFLGAAIQGAAQTVQSVIRAGQRAASDVYVNGSGGSG